MKIDQYISELLYDHDCVIVTDLGGFIANYKPASINPAAHVLSPPSKKLAFNASLKNNDGLLANHIAGKHLLSYMDACEVIRDYVKEATSGMKNGQKLKIEKVGVLYVDNDDRLQFLPDQHANYLIDSFGLPAIHAPLIKRQAIETSASKEPVVIHMTPVTEKKDKSIRIFGWKVLELIPAAAVLALLFMTPPVLREFNTNLSTMLPFSRMNEYLEVIKGEKEPAATVTIQRVNIFEIPPAHAPVKAGNDTQPAELTGTDGRKEEIESIVEKKEPVESREEATPVSTPPAVQPVPVPATQLSNIGSNGKSYHVIGGCFKAEENADKFIAEMKSKGMEARIIGQNKSGLFMVSVFTSGSYNQVADALPEIKSSVNESAWVYKK